MATSSTAAINHPAASSHRRTGNVISAPDLLVALLLVLLSGLPQIGISLSGIELGGETLRPAPLSRSLLLDKLAPEVASLTPPDSSEFPPHTIVPSAAPSLPAETTAASSAPPKPSPWLVNLIKNLYRHHSSYI